MSPIAREAAVSSPRDPGVDQKLAISRRRLLQGAAISLIVPIELGALAGAARAAAAPTPNLGAYIEIASDNSVTVFVGATEMGQGILTGFAQLVAEELGYDMTTWKTVKSVHSPVGSTAYYNPMFGIQGTGGSTSMRAWYLPLRRAAALARQMLIAAGAAALNSAPTACAASNGSIYVIADPTKKVGFGAIATAAAKLSPGNFNPNALTTTRKLIGVSAPRVDIPAKVQGAAIFGLDVRLPGMVYAAVKHCPTLGGTFTTPPQNRGGALQIVPLKNAAGHYNAVAAVSTDSWSAMQMAESISVAWTIPAASAAMDTTVIRSAGQTLLTSGAPNIMEPVVGAPDAALAGSAIKIDETYDLPYLAHACMEVLNCTVSINVVNGVTVCDIYAPTQGQTPVLFTAQALLPAGAKINVHTTYLGGGLGRKFEQDYISQAVQTAIAVGKPVKLMWSREQDFGNDKYRPCALIRVQAGYDSANGNIKAFIYRNVSPSIDVQHSGKPSDAATDSGAVSGALALPYAIENKRIEYVANPAAVPVGYWRSVGESYNIFAVESAIDELAKAAGQDPFVFRQRLLFNQPGLKVLDAAIAMANKTATPTGSARGIAFMSGFGSFIALIVEISLDQSSKIHVKKAFCAIDCGVVVNPGEVEAQMQSGIAHGVAATLWGEITFTKGVPSVKNFDHYPIVKLAGMPTITVQTVDSGAISGGPLKTGGVGETGVPCVAPAIANAYAKLTGNRQRVLPFYPGTTMGDL